MLHMSVNARFLIFRQSAIRDLAHPDRFNLTLLLKAPWLTPDLFYFYPPGRLQLRACRSLNRPN